MAARAAPILVRELSFSNSVVAVMPLAQHNHLYDTIDPSNFAKDALKDKVVLVCILL